MTAFIQRKSPLPDAEKMRGGEQFKNKLHCSPDHNSEQYKETCRSTRSVKDQCYSIIRVLAIWVF